MKRLRKILITTAIAGFLGSAPILAQSNAPHWEISKGPAPEMKHVLSQPDIEVFTAPSTIIINVNQPVNVKIFSILGKEISSQKLETGSYEFHLNSHGIYIIKTPGSTCKVAI